MNTISLDTKSDKPTSNDNDGKLAFPVPSTAATAVVNAAKTDTPAKPPSRNHRRAINATQWVLEGKSSSGDEKLAFCLLSTAAEVGVSTEPAETHVNLLSHDHGPAKSTTPHDVKSAKSSIDNSEDEKLAFHFPSKADATRVTAATNDTPVDILSSPIVLPHKQKHVRGLLQSKGVAKKIPKKRWTAEVRSNYVH